MRIDKKGNLDLKAYKKIFNTCFFPNLFGNEPVDKSIIPHKHCKNCGNVLYFIYEEVDWGLLNLYCNCSEEEYKNNACNNCKNWKEQKSYIKELGEIK